MPKLHVARDIENLDSTHLNLRETQHHQSSISLKSSINGNILLSKTVRSMDNAKHRLLKEQCPGISSSAIHSGYHRGRRPLVGNIFYPDIISVHHLHLHVIVRPRLLLLWFKYPPWLPFMWKSDDKVLQEVEKLSSKTN